MSYETSRDKISPSGARIFAINARRRRRVGVNMRRFDEFKSCAQMGSSNFPIPASQCRWNTSLGRLIGAHKQMLMVTISRSTVSFGCDRGNEMRSVGLKQGKMLLLLLLLNNNGWHVKLRGLAYTASMKFKTCLPHSAIFTIYYLLSGL